MPSPFDFGDVEIRQFNAEQTAKFFRSLLRAEASAKNIGIQSTHVPVRVNIPDGGLDAKAQNSSDSSTPLIPVGEVGYQLKRSDLTPKACKQEVQNNDETALKPMIERLLGDGGAYYLVIFEDLTDQKILNRREALETVFANYGYESVNIEIFDASRLISLAQQYPGLAFRFDETLDVGVDFETWRNRRSISSTHNYIVNDDRRKFAKEVRSEVRGDNCSIIRITGLSGVGKSRFIFETLDKEPFSSLVIHAAASNLDDSRLVRHLETDSTTKAILVVDNCSAKYHRALVDRFETQGNRINVITVSDDLNQVTADFQAELSPLADSSIEALVESERPDLNRTATAKIKEFSGGFPELAVRILTNIEFGGWNSEIELPPGQLTKRLLVGSSSDDHPSFRDLRKTLSAFAIFDRVGWRDADGNLHPEFLEIYDVFGLNTIGDTSEIEDIVGYAKQRGLLRGEKALSLQPLPLALLLIKSRIERHDLDDELLQLPTELLQRAETRIPYFNAFESGQDWVSDVLSRSGWFSDTSILETEAGGRVFKSLSRASAEDATKVLRRFFRTRSHPDLKKFTQGRRGMVRALRGIAVWDTTFDEGAKYLRRLALAENESFANNATGVYKGLFSPAYGPVAPTERHPIERLHHIEDGLKGDEAEFELALGAASEALKTQHYTKSGHPERQGARQLPDLWIPESRDDWVSYFELVWNLLVSRIPDDPERANAIVETLTGAARGLVSTGTELSRLVRTTYVHLSELDYVQIDNVIQSTITICEFDIGGLDPDEQEQWEEFKKWLVDKSFHTRFVSFVKISRQYDEEDGGIEKLAKDAVEDKSRLREKYDILFQNNSSNGHEFGKWLAKSDEGFELLDELIEKLNSRAPETLPAFILAYLGELKKAERERFEEVTERFEEEENLRKYYVSLIRIIDPTDEKVQDLFQQIDDGTIAVQELQEFANLTQPYESLSEDTVQEICNRLLDADSQSALSSLRLLHWYYIYPDEGPSLDTPFLTSAVTHDNVLTLDETVNSSRTYEWNEIVEAVVDEEPRSSPNILDAVIDASESERNFIRLAGYSRETLGKIIEADPSGAWSIISTKISSEGISAWWTAEFLSGNLSLGGSLFGRLNWEEVENWIGDDPEERAPVVASSIEAKLPESQDDTTLARELLAEYGHIEPVQNRLESTYFTESWTGSSVTHFKEKKIRMENSLQVEEGRADTSREVLRWGESILERLEYRIASAEVSEEIIGMVDQNPKID